MTEQQLQEKKMKLKTTIDIHHHCQLSDRETEGDMSALHPPSRETSLALVSIIFDLLDEKKKETEHVETKT
jgi:hypothetical protein